VASGVYFVIVVMDLIDHKPVTAIDHCGEPLVNSASLSFARLTKTFKKCVLSKLGYKSESALVFDHLLTRLRSPQEPVSWIAEQGISEITVLIAIFWVLIVMGMFLDVVSVILALLITTIRSGLAL
jgi:hypothetical protein